MKRQAMVEWRGDLKTERGVLDKTRDSFTTRFGASYIGHESKTLECHYSQPFQGFLFLEKISSVLNR
jgi:hypothetical protein